MKFSHSLQFNAVPEWTTKYIGYSQLKRLIYTLQKEKLYKSSSGSPDLESTPLTAEGPRDTYEQRFIDALDKELEKIDSFYTLQETSILANYSEVYEDATTFLNELMNRSLHNGSVDETGRQGTRRSSSISGYNSQAELDLYSEEEDDEECFPGAQQPRIDAQSTHSQPERPRAGSVGSRLIHSITSEILPTMSRVTDFTTSDPIAEQQITMKKRIVACFTQLSELKSFIELNQTGFAKICKKFDKSLDTNIKKEYLQSLSKKSHVFNDHTIENLSNSINEVILMYAKSIGLMDPQHEAFNFQEAERELSLHLREHVVWERNTVWKDMMNLERKAQNVKAEKAGKKSSTVAFKSILKDTEGNIELLDTGETQSPQTMSELLRLTPLNFVKLLLSSTQLIKLTLITAIFVLLLFVSPMRDPLQKNCLAILIYASLLWATETIPLFVTSLLVPLLIVVLPVLKDVGDGHLLSPTESSQYILSTMWSSVIMLLLGGFTLAAALSKYNIAKVLSTHILSSAGTNPKIILLTNMGVALFASMWVSNVAAPVLCYSIIQPLLRTLPRGSTFAKSLILGIALASNIGGMASPIASPQNIISIGMMDPPPSWGQWFIVSLPVCVICVIVIWSILLLTFPPDNNLKILKYHPISDPFTVQQWYITAVTIFTIVLWCLANQLKDVFGEMGIISVIPMLLFFGTGILDSDDFNNFMWTIVILAMGGTTLGKAVTSSGLLSTIASIIKESIETKPIFQIVLIFGIVILIMATFVSHTVAAMIIVPLMKEIGTNLPDGDHSRLLIMVAAFLCSAAMGLPTSGFPNVTAISMIDDVGDRYLSVNNFITRGVPASLVAYFVIVTVGYALMKLIGY
ncbi:unnamed protein product [Kluyveromyces dobzhanskii CBS 2104]|uniref:WGS project CCBQ000000000 data, contig 00015 n=1 Tax=Kluyveromyces dobzhanskii CBS 2104 TaxID=1427455 RepID=A0A0A8L9K6_9SACH|nr:unnamed protein product [Kluyveromyces dobzhanskii CBS 2104]